MVIRIPITPPQAGINMDGLRGELVAVYPDVTGVSSAQGNHYVDLVNGSLVTQEQLQAVVSVHNAAILTAAQQVQTDMTSLQEYAVLAQAHSKTIHALFLAITDADVASANTNTRFATIAEIIEDVGVTSLAFKTRWNAAFTAESGVSVAGLDLTALLLLTAAQKQRYINFARNFTVHYGLMLLWAG